MPGIAHEVRCGRVQRALDPAQPNGRKIDIHYLVVPAIARRKLPDPVMLLAGGPGQSAISLAPMAMPLFAQLNNRRDIVFVDQRGTGRSAPLECVEPKHQLVAEQAEPTAQLASLRECRERLQALPYGDLRFFTTWIATQDLDAVRTALGAPRVNLVGASYGTRAALDYLRQFPQAVRRVVLDGVAPPDMALPASFSLDGQAALNATFEACEKEAPCARRFPDLRSEWSAWLARLPQSVTVEHPLTGATERFTLTREMALAATRGPLYSPVLAQALPQAIHEAAQGRAQALLTLGSGLSPRKNTSVYEGMHFSVVCAEDVPRLAQTADAPGVDFGAEAAKQYERVCADWPRGAVPAAFYAVPPSASPVLLLSGGADPATPPRHAIRVAALLGNKAKSIVLPQASHGVMSAGCMPEVMRNFIDEEDDARALGVDARCAAAIPRPAAFVPTGAKGARP